jgi:hypothetical protein
MTDQLSTGFNGSERQYVTFLDLLGGSPPTAAGARLLPAAPQPTRSHPAATQVATVRTETETGVARDDAARDRPIVVAWLPRASTGGRIATTQKRSPSGPSLAWRVPSRRRDYVS